METLYQLAKKRFKVRSKKEENLITLKVRSSYFTKALYFTDDFEK